MQIKLFSKIKQKDISLKLTYKNDTISMYKPTENIIIQTPKLLIPFGINQFYNNQYLNVAVCNQPKFINFIRRFDRSIKKQLSKEYSYTKSIYFYKNQKMNLFKTKLPPHSKFLQIYDSQKNKLSIKDIVPNSFGILLIQPTSINIYENKVKCIWHVLQIKLFLPFMNIHKCLILDNDNDTESDEEQENQKKICCPNCHYLFYEKIKESRITIPKEYDKFEKMLRCGVPRICVEHKMKMEGLNPILLNNITNLKKPPLIQKTKKLNFSELHSELLKGKKLNKTKIRKRNRNIT